MCVCVSVCNEPDFRMLNENPDSEKEKFVFLLHAEKGQYSLIKLNELLLFS